VIFRPLSPLHFTTLVIAAVLVIVTVVLGLVIADVADSAAKGQYMAACVATTGADGCAEAWRLTNGPHD
jgi:hypothetical protein